MSLVVHSHSLFIIPYTRNTNNNNPKHPTGLPQDRAALPYGPHLLRGLLRRRGTWVRACMHTDWCRGWVWGGLQRSDEEGKAPRVCVHCIVRALPITPTYPQTTPTPTPTRSCPTSPAPASAPPWASPSVRFDACVRVWCGIVCVYAFGSRGLDPAPGLYAWDLHTKTQQPHKTSQLHNSQRPRRGGEGGGNTRVPCQPGQHRGHLRGERGPDPGGPF